MWLIKLKNTVKPDPKFGLASGTAGSILVLTAYLHEAVSPLSLAVLSLVLIHFRQVTPHLSPLPGEKERWLLQC